MTFNIYIIWFFFIYAFLGWCTEVVYAAAETGKYVNRGFLNGPACPIYGIGVILVLHLLDPVKENVFSMFIGSVIITSLIEFTAGFILEKIFHQRWWDYSDKPFNIGGYICPEFSLTWGLACLVVADRIHPLIVTFVNWVPHTVSQVLLFIFACIFAIDLTATVRSILNLNRKLEIMDDLTLKIREASDNIGENLATGTIAIVQKKEDIEESIEATKDKLEENLSEVRDAQHKALEHRRKALDELHKANREFLEATALGQKRLLKAFPGLRSIEHKEALEELKKHILKDFNTEGDRK